MLYTFSQRFGAATKATEHNKLCPFQGCTAQARKTEKHLNNGHFSRLSRSHSLSLCVCICVSRSNGQIILRLCVRQACALHLNNLKTLWATLFGHQVQMVAKSNECQWYQSPCHRIPLAPPPTPTPTPMAMARIYAAHYSILTYVQAHTWLHTYVYIGVVAGVTECECVCACCVVSVVYARLFALRPNGLPSGSCNEKKNTCCSSVAISCEISVHTHLCSGINMHMCFIPAPLLVLLGTRLRLSNHPNASGRACWRYPLLW